MLVSLDTFPKVPYSFFTLNSHFKFPAAISTHTYLMLKGPRLMEVIISLNIFVNNTISLPFITFFYPALVPPSTETWQRP